MMRDVKWLLSLMKIKGVQAKLEALEERGYPELADAIWEWLRTLAVLGIIALATAMGALMGWGDAHHPGRLLSTYVGAITMGMPTTGVCSFCFEQSKSKGVQRAVKFAFIVEIISVILVMLYLAARELY